MIFDLRIYTCQPGKAIDWLKLYEEKGLPVQLKHLGKPVFVTTTEVGSLNQVIHCWPYQSMAERAVELQLEKAGVRLAAILNESVR